MIALITNLPNNNHFLRRKLENTNSQDLLVATGGNTGNVAFVHAAQAILAEEYQVIDWGANPKVVREKFTKIVVCCANQIGSHVDLKGWGERLQEFGLPVVLIGLGAQSNKIGVMPEVPQGTIEFLEIVRGLRANPEESNILTRGEFSSWVLEQLGFDSSPFGCPSLLTSKEVGLGKICLDNQLRKYKRLMVPAGNPFHPSASIEQKLVDLVDKYDGEYVLQHPKILFSLMLDDNPSITDKQKDLLMSIYHGFESLNDIKSWLQAKSVFFADAPHWLNYSRKFTSAIGPRYHGIALPIQVGVAGKVIAIDSRTEELAMTTGIPFIKYTEVKSMSLEELNVSSEWSLEDAEKLDHYRNKNSKLYLDFMHANNIKPRPHLKNL